MSEHRGYKLAAMEGAECGDGFGKSGACSFGFWLLGGFTASWDNRGFVLILISQTESAIHTVNGDSGDVLHTHQEAVRFGV